MNIDFDDAHSEEGEVYIIFAIRPDAEKPFTITIRAQDTKTEKELIPLAMMLSKLLTYAVEISDTWVTAVAKLREELKKVERPQSSDVDALVAGEEGKDEH